MKPEWKTILPLLHDTHCHVNLYPDPGEVREQIARDCMRVVHVTTSPAEYVECAAAGGSTGALAPGLVPQEIGELAPQLDLFCELIAAARFVGEVGLDYVTEDQGERQLQRSVFERILRCCEDCGDRILTIHSRRAAADVITMLDGFRGTPILHWFSGTQEQVRAAPENVYFSINTAMIVSRRGRNLIAAMPRDRLLLETDGPFVRIDERPVRPHDLYLVVDFFARQWGCSAMEAAAQLAANFSGLEGAGA
jgi:TatD DNase family protein